MSARTPAGRPAKEPRAGGVEKSLARQVWDLLGAPLRLILLPDDTAERLGFTSLEAERIGAVWPHLEGRVLDIGAGRNRLVQRYGHGVGVDVHDWGGGALRLRDTACLPFADASFDTVTFLACLNHIPEREAALREAARVLRPGGRVLITMIAPILGGIGHRLWWYSEDKHRQVADGELDGMWTRDILRLCRESGLEIVTHRRFVYGLNNLYIARRPRVTWT